MTRSRRRRDVKQHLFLPLALRLIVIIIVIIIVVVIIIIVIIVVVVIIIIIIIVVVIRRFVLRRTRLAVHRLVRLSGTAAVATA